MVSVSVLSILVLMFTSLFTSASHAWIMGTGNAERRRNSRALTDYIGSELKAALLPLQTLAVQGGNAQTVGNLQFLINPSGNIPAAYQNADSIFWQAPLATESTYGDIAEVGYFVKWQDNGKGETLPILCRFFVNPSTTSTTGTISPNPKFLIFDPSSATSWLTPELIDDVAPATAATGYLGFFGENVVGLWVRSYALDGTELPRNFDSRVGYTANLKKTDDSGNIASWTETRYLPYRVQVSIAQVDSHYAPMLSAAAPTLKQLTGSTAIRDADDFLQAFRQQAAGSSSLKALLPGMRIYSTQVLLTNAQ